MPAAAFKQLASGVNAFTFQFPDALLKALREAYQQQLLPLLSQPAKRDWLAGGFYVSQPLGLEPADFYAISYDTYPLLWLTNHSAQSYQLFHDFFEHSGLIFPMKPQIDHRRTLVMYSGFFVVGNRAPETMWHYDYRPGAQAYTLITPLFDWQPAHGHLLYELPDKREAVYTYRLNEAIMFGEGFLHTTQPYECTDTLRVLVSLTFGTDKWKYWETLRLNIEEQSHYYALPCGHIVNSCQCQGKGLYQRLKRSLQGCF